MHQRAACQAVRHEQLAAYLQSVWCHICPSLAETGLMPGNRRSSARSRPAPAPRSRQGPAVDGPRPVRAGPSPLRRPRSARMAGNRGHRPLWLGVRRLPDCFPAGRGRWRGVVVAGDVPSCPASAGSGLPAGASRRARRIPHGECRGFRPRPRSCITSKREKRLRSAPVGRDDTTNCQPSKAKLTSSTAAAARTSTDSSRPSSRRTGDEIWTPALRKSAAAS